MSLDINTFGTKKSSHLLYSFIWYSNTIGESRNKKEQDKRNYGLEDTIPW